jgi:hypothetical protein
MKGKIPCWSCAFSRWRPYYVSKNKLWFVNISSYFNRLVSASAFDLSVFEQCHPSVIVICGIS